MTSEHEKLICTFIGGLIAAVVMLFFISPSIAAPTTGAVTMTDPNTAVFTATGGSGQGWFQWGAVSGGPYIWYTPNQTVSGAFTDIQEGNPMLTSKTYYVRACDDTGCGGEVSWAVPNATLPDQTSFGSGLIPIMRSGFNLTRSIPLIVEPYTNVIDTEYGAALIWGILFMFIFSSYWVRTGDITIPMMLAFLFGASMVWGSYGWGMPPIFIDVGVGLCAAALAGTFMSWFR